MNDNIGELKFAGHEIKMGNKSKIEWTDSVLNVVTGCGWKSTGCDNCYAKTMANRLKGMGQERYKNGFDVTLHPDVLMKPFNWKRQRKIFVCSMSDLFHERVPFSFISAVFGVAAMNPQHTFQMLTKRPERMLDFFVFHRFEEKEDPIRECIQKLSEYTGVVFDYGDIDWPLKNVWLGVTAENQACADERVPLLLKCPAEKRFVSCEPLIGRLNIEKWLKRGSICGCKEESCKEEKCNETMIRCNYGTRKIDWVIAGGESGRNARPMHPDWARSLRDQCIETNTRFFFKQFGEWICVYDRDIDDPDWRNVPKEDKNKRYLNIDGGSGFHGDRLCLMEKVGKGKAGKTLDGEVWSQFPVD